MATTAGYTVQSVLLESICSISVSEKTICSVDYDTSTVTLVRSRLQWSLYFVSIDPRCILMQVHQASTTGAGQSLLKSGSCPGYPSPIIYTKGYPKKRMSGNGVISSHFQPEEDSNGACLCHASHSHTLTSHFNIAPPSSSFLFFLSLSLSSAVSVPSKISRSHNLN